MATKQRAATHKKTIKRGPRKGMQVEVYSSSGTEVRRGDVATGERRVNRSKKNPRASKPFDTAIDAKGREVHTYADGESVTLTGKRHKAVQFAKKSRYEDGSSGFTVAQRKAATSSTTKPASRTSAAKKSATKKKPATPRKPAARKPAPRKPAAKKK